MSKLFAPRQVRQALNTRNGPEVSEIHNTPIGALVLVYRPEKNRWDGPYSFLDMCGEDVIVLTPKGDAKFRSIVIKPYVTPALGAENESDELNSAAQLPTAADVHHSHWTSQEIASHDSPFKTSRIVEFNGLMEQNVFELVPASDAKGCRIYESRFVDSIKNSGRPNAFKKYRLVVQVYNDSDYGLLTHAPTVQRVFQRLLLCLCAIDPSLRFFTGDISQAYVQAETSTHRQIYVRPSFVLDLLPGFLLRVNRPLYGLPEAGLHWYRTYHKHHVKALNPNPIIHDS